MTEQVLTARLFPELGRRQSPRPFGILVVDDELGVRALLEIWLRKQGFAVWLAAGGQEALTLYRNDLESIDLVLLDLRMPGMDGAQTLAALQELNSSVCTCFMSEDTGHYTAEHLRELGAAAILPKPFRLGEVAQVLRQKLAGRLDLSYAGD